MDRIIPSEGIDVGSTPTGNTMIHTKKVIIIGTSLTGKTTLVKFLRETQKIKVSEIDEELTKLNDGVFPTDDKYKTEVLTPIVISELLDNEEIIFFTNTDYFSADDLKIARVAGFKIVQLVLTKYEMETRNSERMESEGYEDHSEWFDGMLEYQREIFNLGLVDLVIDAGMPTKEIAKELVDMM